MRRPLRAAAIAGILALGCTKSASGPTTVGPGPLATITVSPNPDTLSLSATQQFSAVGRDAAGAVVAFTPTWSAVGGGGTLSSTGLFAAGTSPGSSVVTAKSGTISGSAAVTVIGATGAPGPLATISVTPGPDTLVVFGTQLFTAVGRDSAGAVVAFTPTWSVASGGGAINSSGLFTAGPSPSTAIVRATSGGIFGAATITVVAGMTPPGTLATITVSPNPDTLALAATQQFTAVGKDGGGNVVAFTPIWSVSSGGGTINGSGVFTTGASSGTSIVQATSGAIVGSAAVTVLPRPLASITLSPNLVILATSATQQFTAVGKDATGNVVAFTPTWSVANGGGTITSSGLFTAGSTAGTFSNTVKAASGGITGLASVTVTASSTLDLTIDGLYLMQSVQNYAGTVPLITGQQALLRVFGRANRANAAAASVRVQFYSSGTVINTIVIQAAPVPQAITEGTLGSSWNALIPGTLIQPGVSVLADIDPDNSVPEASKQNNSFPASGIPRALDVRAASVPRFELVPVTQSLTGLTGDVSDNNKDTYLDFTQQIYAIPSYDVAVRAPYTTSIGLDTVGGLVGWDQILSEINVLELADGTRRHYIGVVRTINRQAAGISHEPGFSTLVTDDDGFRGQTVAHELGHSWGRSHSPGCGAVPPVDPNYPYAGGTIGVYGFNLITNQLVPPTYDDVMAYCFPFIWVSDYTFEGVLNYRQLNPAPPVLAPQPVLLIWGRIENGVITMEPTFTVSSVASLPIQPGPYRVEGLNQGGAVLFSYSFAPQIVADAPTDAAGSFAFAVPTGTALAAGLATVRVSGGGQELRRTIGHPAGVAPQGVPVPVSAPPVAAQRVAGGRVRISWDAELYPMVMVRDAQTRQILSFARGGSVDVATNAPQLELVLPDDLLGTPIRVTP